MIEIVQKLNRKIRIVSTIPGSDPLRLLSNSLTLARYLFALKHNMVVTQTTMFLVTLVLKRLYSLSYTTQTVILFS